jgi:hypothetical protein
MYEICTKEAGTLAIEALEYFLFRKDTGNRVSFCEAARYVLMENGCADPNGDTKATVITLMNQKWRRFKKGHICNSFRLRPEPKNGHWMACPDD